jgi:hypothetical protein
VQDGFPIPMLHLQSSEDYTINVGYLALQTPNKETGRAKSRALLACPVLNLTFPRPNHPTGDRNLPNRMRRSAVNLTVYALYCVIIVMPC